MSKHTLRSRMGRLPAVRFPFVAARHINIRKTDVILASYPKSGNTWLKFLLFQLVTGADPDFDSVEELIPPIGGQKRARPSLPGAGRLIKSHEAWRWPSPVAIRRAIYVCRDGRDVAVSYYYHQQSTGAFEGTFSEFLTAFLAGRLDGYGTWRDHVRSWILGCRADLLVIRYEQLKEAPLSTLERVCEFLRLNVSTVAMEAALSGNTVARMRSLERNARVLERHHRSDIPIVRKGISGDWRNHFSKEDSEAFARSAGDALTLLP